MRRTATSIVFAVALSSLVLAPQQDLSGQPAKGTVVVTGDVLYPGEYPLTPGLAALELLTLAAGSQNDTVHSLIIRRGKKGEPDELPLRNRAALASLVAINSAVSRDSSHFAAEVERGFVLRFQATRLCLTVPLDRFSRSAAGLQLNLDPVGLTDRVQIAPVVLQ